MASSSIELQGLLRLVCALFCGAVIGLEREHGHRPAGLRTHTLVCLGSCLVMVASFWVTAFYSLDIDPMRMSAQVISGIGFLGAGTIIKAGRDVRGLTTAACLWIVACIGLAIGAGYYVGGIGVTALTLLTLHIFKILELRMQRGGFELFVRAKNEPDIVSAITAGILAQDVKINRLSADQDGDMVRVAVDVHLPPKLRRAEFASAMMSIPGVMSVTDQPL